MDLDLRGSAAPIGGPLGLAFAGALRLGFISLLEQIEVRLR